MSRFGDSRTLEFLTSSCHSMLRLVSMGGFLPLKLMPLLLACGWMLLGSATSANELRERPDEKKLPLTVSAPAAMPARISPVTGGIPFPRGELLATDGIRLLDASGRDVAVQTEVLATWDAAGKEVKWLLVDITTEGWRPRTR